ncbi:MAG: hypothetical protein RDV41_13330, partial [Planctomycetota bacterium]|nr:hypothetical protein [Planctomycetota bacterium]
FPMGEGPGVRDEGKPRVQPSLPHPDPLPGGEGTFSPLPLGEGSGVRDEGEPRARSAHPHPDLLQINHGVIVVATGAEELKPKDYREFLYGTDPRVVTQVELEERIHKGQFKAGTVVMVQCVGSRDKTRPYCSRICCYVAVKNALKIKEISPETDVYILYRDIRTYGFNETLYTKAREVGVRFIRFDDDRIPAVKSSPLPLAEPERRPAAAVREGRILPPGSGRRRT